MTDDKALLERIRAGDKTAFEELLRAKDDILFGVARKILRNDSDAEDAVYETYAELVQKLDRIRDPAALSAWLITTVKHKAFDILRKNGRSLAPPDAAEGESYEPDYADALQVSESLKSLPPEQFDALMLYNSGLKLREIARLINKPVTSVWALLKRAKENFIRHYQG